MNGCAGRFKGGQFRLAFPVTVAHRGSDAVGLVRSEPEISLVLMKIELDGGTDGTAAAGEILGIRELPILFLIGRTEEEYLKRVEKVTSKDGPPAL